MGRKKKPVDLVLQEGKTHLTKKQIEERQQNEIKPKLTTMKPPSELKKALHKRFNMYVELLNEHKIIDSLDLNMLARYVETENMYWMVTKEINAVMDYPNLDIREIDRLSSIQDRYMKACRSMANDLGLTMVSRLKMVVPSKDNEEREKTDDELMFGGML